MELSVTLRDPRKRAELFGAGDRHLRRIRDTFGVRLQARNALVRLSGEPAGVAKAAAVIERLQDLLRGRTDLDEDAVDEVIAEVEQSEGSTDVDALRVFSREAVVPKTDGQRNYLRAMLENDLVFCLGPAGTGKTYLAVAIAVHLLKVGKSKRIVLVRPAVEAGERLGFLPGDLQQKVNPYLRPLFDAMHDMMTFDQLKRFMVNDIIEVIPLAYMRGRTLNHALVILDEAQNTTVLQMLMFLTRLGHHSKMIVTGDDSQVDLAPGQPSGLEDAVRRLRGCAGVATLRLYEADIVRHRLVQDIVNRYGDRDANRAPPAGSSYNQQTPGETASAGPDGEHER
ncbi:MAG: PhoH family protein [Phycisphaerae bacterium]